MNNCVLYEIKGVIVRFYNYEKLRMLMKLLI
jgi:hypothetical protein